MELRASLMHRVEKWFMKDKKLERWNKIYPHRLAEWESMITNKYTDAMRTYENQGELAEFDLIDMENELRSNWVTGNLIDRRTLPWL